MEVVELGNDKLGIDIVCFGYKDNFFYYCYWYES